MTIEFTKQADEDLASFKKSGKKQIIEKRTGLSMRQFLKKCIHELESMSNVGILSGLGDLLDAKQKIWVKNELRTETIFLLQLKLETVLELTLSFLFPLPQPVFQYNPPHDFYVLLNRHTLPVADLVILRMY